MHRLKIVIRLGYLGTAPDVPTARHSHGRVPQAIQGLNRPVYISPDTQFGAFNGRPIISPVSLANSRCRSSIALFTIRPPDLIYRTYITAPTSRTCIRNDMFDLHRRPLPTATRQLARSPRSDVRRVSKIGCLRQPARLMRATDEPPLPSLPPTPCRVARCHPYGRI